MSTPDWDVPPRHRRRQRPQFRPAAGPYSATASTTVFGSGIRSGLRSPAEYAEGFEACEYGALLNEAAVGRLFGFLR